MFFNKIILSIFKSKMQSYFIKWKSLVSSQLRWMQCPCLTRSYPMYLVHTCSIYTVMKLMNITLWTYNQDCRNNIYISLPPGGLDTNTHKLKELSRWPTLHPRGGSRGGGLETFIRQGTESHLFMESQTADRTRAGTAGGIHSAWPPAMTPLSGCCRSPGSAA